MVEISVLLAVYNGENYLEECLESLFAQDFPKEKYKILCLDDGSTDNTLSILKKFEKKGNVLVFQNETNKRLPFSLNRLLDEVKSDFLIRFDADDIAFPNLLSSLHAQIGHHDFCHPYMNLFDESPNQSRPYSVRDLASFFASGVLFRSHRICSLKFSDLFWEEFDMYLKLLEGGGTFTIHKEPLLYHRIHQDNMTGNKEKFEKAFSELANKWGIEVLDKYQFNLPRLKEAYGYYFEKEARV